MRRLALILALTPALVSAQEQGGTLGDIRAGLDALASEVRALEQHLQPGAPAGDTLAGSSALERVEAMGRELARLTARTEELEHHIGNITRDAGARLDDLDRRLCALEGNCTPLPAAPPPAVATAPDDERGVFEAARVALDAGQNAEAARLFADHLARWPRGPLATEAELLRGRALERGGDARGAARSYLKAFSADKDGPLAAESLTALGQAMAAMGQTIEACVTLDEVTRRFADSPAAIAASGARAGLACQ